MMALNTLLLLRSGLAPLLFSKILSSDIIDMTIEGLKPRQQQQQQTDWLKLMMHLLEFGKGIKMLLPSI